MKCILVGVDVGSTTVKTVAVSPIDGSILWTAYERHETRQGEKVSSQLEALEQVLREPTKQLEPAFGHVPYPRIRTFITGSGGRPLAEPLGAKFFQEVNAVTLAVERRHPDVGSLI